MWSLYLLPGRAITRLLFLFPGHRSGNITATRRRDESGCAHFLFATLFWIPVGLIGALFAIALIVGPPPAGRGRRAPAATAGTAFHTATTQALDLVGVGHNSDNDSVAPDPAATRSDGAADVDQAAAQIAANPHSAPKVERAMIKAARKGRPMRWKQDRLKGSAVPSDPVDGCRTIQVSIDSAPDLAITPIEMCEEAQ